MLLAVDFVNSDFFNRVAADKRARLFLAENFAELCLYKACDIVAVDVVHADGAAAF